jgi:predicted nucleic acid-binding protein
MWKMRESKQLVINTGPLIALVAALGDLRILETLYDQVIVPFDVGEEIMTGGASGFAVAQFEEAQWLQCRLQPIDIEPYLLNLLERGQASVIQLARGENINLNPMRVATK